MYHVKSPFLIKLDSIDIIIGCYQDDLLILSFFGLMYNNFYEFAPNSLIFL